jgi:uncharacterized membrane protein YfcA
VLAGLLGVGGGLVLVGAVVWVLPSQGVPQEFALHSALATSLASIILTGLSSARAHHRRGAVMWSSVYWLAPGMALGGVLGAAFATGLNGATLRWLVAGYCFLAAAQLLCGQPRAAALTCAPQGPRMAAAGLGIGAVAAVVGIGGGSMTVPLLIWLGATPLRAIGTSAACGVAVALASAAGYAGFGPPPGTLPPGSVGFVFLPAALGIAAASVLCAPLGTALAHRISPALLRRLFALLLTVVGGLLLW